MAPVLAPAAEGMRADPGLAGLDMGVVAAPPKDKRLEGAPPALADLVDTAGPSCRLRGTGRARNLPPAEQRHSIRTGDRRPQRRTAAVV